MYETSTLANLYQSSGASQATSATNIGKIAMYRLSYIVCYNIPGFANAGDRREILFSTNYAIVAFNRWRTFDYVTDVTLEYWSNSNWQQFAIYDR